LASDEDNPRLYHGTNGEGKPAPQMNTSDCLALLNYLRLKAKLGYSLLTWNGLGFDFDVLCEESGEARICEDLALAHVDMMFHLHCLLGFPLALDKCCKGMSLPGKPDGVDGAKAPKLWAAGQHQQVLDYVAQDVRAAMAVCINAEQRKGIRWITRKGTPSACPLPNGWLTVLQARELPEPDTSWMSDPLTRASFLGWIRGAATKV
jgi:hypothetical protein